MKRILSIISALVLKLTLSFLYFFLKLLPTRNKVVMISRQDDRASLDFRLLKDELIRRDNGVEVVFLCKKMGDGFLKKIPYFFHLVSCVYYLAISRACIVDSYCIPVCNLKHKEELVIVQIWHALGAVKKFGHQSLNTEEGRSERMAKILNMHKNYTFVTCASVVTKKVYEEAFGTPAESVVTDGMPRIDNLMKSGGAARARIRKKYANELEGKVNLLYVPTFRTGRKIDIAPLCKEIDFSKYNLFVKLHPADAEKCDEKRAIFPKESTLDIMRTVDYVITDYSAVCFEAALLEKPLFFYVFDIDEYDERRGRNIDLFEEMPKATFVDFADVMKVIKENKYDHSALISFKNKYIETADTNNCKRIVDRIYSLWGA